MAIGSVTSLLEKRPAWLVPAAVSAFASAMLGGAFAFQYLGGLAPCVLCLYQRWPHAAAILLGLLALILSARNPAASRWLTILGGLALLTSAGIGLFHVGVEQLWWEGTAECGATGTPDSLDALKQQLMAQPVVRCTDIAWEMFGISMAGYNFLLSAGAGLTAIALSLPGRR
ncbi:disulfide bond formation protein B [Nisaea acidiphila]|uniref:Disulfide bond formation protein B n=1 Tax=Nisaea acidiphila TaxID=1862145 RepID=A0A9J7AX77_9PROT|nr:disulfide bond formation protein B [Nisaea acidiphila]UUX51033.1 disulfide bond formation protein B [Nisaea acidiphila]